MALVQRIVSVFMAASGNKLTDIQMSEENNTVRDIKEQLQAQLGFPRFQQRVLLDKESQQLADTYILNPDTKQIFVVLVAYINMSRSLEIELLHAINYGPAEDVEAILQRPQHPDWSTKEICQCCGQKQITPLELASKCNRTDIVQMVLQAKADVARPGSDLSLHEAATHNNTDIASMLVQANADTNIHCPTTRTTPLIEAASRHHWEVMHTLLDSRASPNACDPLGSTPLHIACGQDSLEPVLALLQHGASINARDAFNHTPVDVAMCSRNANMLVCLRSELNDYLLDCSDSDDSETTLIFEVSSDTEMSDGTQQANGPW